MQRNIQQASEWSTRIISSLHLHEIHQIQITT